jgi:hypothetical protein
MPDKTNKAQVRPAPVPNEEKRGTARHGVLRQGQISFDGHIVYCAVRDFSATGARLQVGVDLPPSFDLVVDGRKEHLRAELKWRRGQYAGVSFQQPPLSTAEVEEVKPRQRLTPRRPNGNGLAETEWRGPRSLTEVDLG